MSKHPVFGRTKQTGKGSGAIKDTKKGVKYTESPYYYWWRALTLSEPYKALCKSNGEGGNEKLREVYADFGDVFACEFDQWWRKKGAALFGEPQGPDRVTRISIAEVDAYKASVDAKQALLLIIPLSISRRVIASDVKRLIAKNHSGKRGRSKEAESLAKSGARYKVRHYKSIVGLRWALHVFEKRREGKLLKELARGGYADDPTSVSRARRLGETIIRGVEQGVFPLTIVRKNH
jgi:hypothetical protein